MTHVCHMTSAHCSDDGRIFKKECVSLAEESYEVSLVAPGESRFDRGIQVYGVGQGGSRLSRMLITARKVYKVASSLDADIYHFHDPELLPYGVKLANVGKCVVFDSHENYFEQICRKRYIPKVIRPTIARLYRSYESHALKRFSGVVVPCTFRGQSIFEGRAKRNAFVGNGCLVPAMLNPQDVMFDRSECDAICYLGSLTYARGITHLVKAADEAGVRLVLCGPITDEYLHSLRAMPEYRCVDYRGVLSSEELADVMDECFLGVASGLDQGQYGIADVLPTKVPEYLMHGLPIILFSSPFNDSFMDKCPCGKTVRFEDIPALVETIASMRGNRQMCLRMAQVGFDYALEHLTWQHDERELLNLYADIVEGELGGRR